MTSKHTPGPWRVGDVGHTVFGPPNGNPSPLMVAQRIRPSDAALIAAAPDLLEALRDLLAEYDPHGYMTDPGLSSHRPILAARAAIAKATGEGK